MLNTKDQPAIQVKNLSAVFRSDNGGLQALEDVSFEVQHQEFLCVLGPSGSGKSTLLRILAGLLPPTAGQVLYAGEPLSGPKAGLGFVFQKASSTIQGAKKRKDGSKMTCQEWADRNGFIWAEQTIPEEWLK